MNSKPGSRLGKKIAGKELNPSLKNKIEVLENKYHDFIANCSSFLQDESKVKPDIKSSSLNEKLVQKREPYNEYFKENIKLRNENSVLTKTIQELSSKLSEIEGLHTETILNKDFEGKIQLKKHFLDQQEKNMLILQQELDKTKNELCVIKNRYKEPENQQIRSVTPGICSSAQKAKIQLPKTKEYTPVTRKKIGSPISRSVSPKDRNAHNTKQEINNLKQELEHTKEERNLYKY